MNLLPVALDAATQAGQLLRQHFGGPLKVNELQAHDIKLELDVRSQRLITDIILAHDSIHAILGEEEGDLGGDGDIEWIVDPIDGTVNFFYGIPHFCVSIAARQRSSGEMLLGVIHDPMQQETWSVLRGEGPLLNGRPIACSARHELADAVVTVGFSKSREALDAGFDRYKRIACAVRKTRMLGSAALALAYIATGRLDAYIEEQISLWDIAAGVMLVEAGGGRVHTSPSKVKPGSLFICADNGRLPISALL